MLGRLRSRCALVAFSAAAVVAVAVGFPDRSEAGIFLDMNFNSETLGSPIMTTAPATENPELHAYSTGGFPALGYNGSNKVVNEGFNHAVRMFTNQAGTGANFIDTQFAVVSADIVTLDFDIRIAAQSNGLYPQDAAHAPNGQMFAINAFAWNTPNRVFRFAAAPTSGSTGIFGMRDNAGGDLITLGQYNVGDDYHVSIVANYLTGTVDASVSELISGNLVGSLNGLQFVDGWPGTFGMSEFFIFQNNVGSPEGAPSADNIVLLDNLVGATLDAPVPEPSSLAIFAIGSACCAGFARRRQVNAA